MVYYLKNLPLRSEIKGKEDLVPLVIHDRYLESHDDFRTWMGHLDGISYPIRAGEELKSIDHFPTHVRAILRKTQGFSRRQLVIVSVGGGSVGDFSGFIASTLKRGVRLIHIPSTWLAAIDSSHGGKTALNVDHYKNQMGSFYPAEKIIICKDLLKTLPPSQTLSAMGELCKMAMIQGGDFYQQFKQIKDWNFENLWRLLPQAVYAKYQIIEQDPREEKGLREKLNLGHTLGHVLETVHELSHGEAVAQGLWFSLHWSGRGGNDTGELDEVLLNSVGPKREYKVTEPELRDRLFHDKKLLPHSSINFVFLHSPGNVSVKPVTIDSFVDEAKRQGWVHV